MPIKINTDWRQGEKRCRFKDLDYGAVFLVVDDNLSEMEGRGGIFMKVLMIENSESMGREYNAVNVTDESSFVLETIKENAICKELASELRIDYNEESWY